MPCAGRAWAIGDEVEVVGATLSSMPSARSLLALALLAVSAASASAQGWTEPDPAAVIGRWTGTVSWKSCAIDGATKATLDVARDGSGYRLDLAPLADGLGVESFAPTGGPVLEAHHADLTATWRAGKPGRARLEVTLGGGCAAVATLARASVGAPACDELVALTAIASTCSAATVPTSTAVPGRSKSAAAACRRDAAPLRAALVTAGCVPVAPVGRGAVPIPQCDTLIATVLRGVRCDRINSEMKQRFLDQIRVVARSAAISDPDTRADFVDSCRTTATSLDELLTRLGC